MAGENFREGVSDAIRTSFCNFADDIVNFGHWFYDTTAPGFLPRRDMLPREPLLAGGVAGLICGDVPATPYPPAETIPFAGGQCVGTVYALTVDVIRNGIPTTFTNTVIGPIGTPRYEVDGGRHRGRWYDPSGENVIWTFDSISTGFPQPSIESFGINSVVSGPDDCGDLPPTPSPPPDPGSNIFTPDVEYDPGTGPVVLPTTVTFALPIVNINGNLTVPFTIDGLTFALDGELSVTTGDINFNFGGGTSVSDLCCLADIVDEIIPDLPTDDPPENDEFYPRIVAVVVTTTAIDSDIRASTIGQENGPDFYHARLGNIHFNVGRRGKRIWTQDIPVRNARQLIVCPVDYGAASVVGDPIQGVTWTLTPLYRRVVETDFPN